MLKKIDLPLLNRYFLVTYLTVLCARMTTFIYLGQGENLFAHGFLSRGAVSDAATALVFALLLTVTHRFRQLTLIIIGFLCFACASNIANIGVNFSNLSTNDSRFLSEKSFLVKSIFSFDIMGLTLLFSGGAYALYQALAKFNPLPVRNKYFFYLYAALALQIWIPITVELPFWQQYNLFEENMVTMLTSEEAAAYKDEKRVQQEYERFMRLDLSGTPIMQGIVDPPQPRKPNILIITIEGLSQQFVTEDVMPNLKRMGDTYIHYPNFLLHQRFTENGLYSITCGDMPTMYRQVRILGATAGGKPTRVRVGKRNSPNKWSAISRQPPVNPCLPQLLANEGYDTAFFQASDLRFTNKEGFMSNAGMLKLYSSQRLQELYPITDEDKDFIGRSFGMPDGMFFPRVAKELIRINEQKKPWFATVMTTSTHFPFFVTDNLKSRFSDSTVGSFATADAALGNLFTTLEQNKLLENTLVIVTGDESGAIIKSNDVAGMMVGNWGTVVVKTPDNIKYTSEDYFSQSDLMTSIFDYMGLPKEKLRGRSLFRKYNEFRPLMFANIRTDRFFAWYEPDRLVACAHYFKICQNLYMSGPLFAPKLREAGFDKGVASLYIQVARKSDYVNIKQRPKKRVRRVRKRRR